MSDIIDLITKDPEYLDYCKKCCNDKDIHKDLYQYIILYLMEMDKDKLKGLYERGELKMYVARMIYLSAKSKTSQFYRQMTGIEFDELTHKMNVVVEERTEVDDLLDKFDEELKRECNACINTGAYPVSAKIYEIYESVGSIPETARATRIPYTTIVRHIKQTRTKIINKLNDKDSSSNKSI